MDRLARDAVFGDEADREAARWSIWELGQAGRRSAIVDPRALHGARPRRGARLHGAGDQRAWHGIRHGAVGVPDGANGWTPARSFCEIARSEIGYTDQRPAEYVGGDPGGRAARRVPRAGVHPGRPLPGQRQEVRGRPAAEVDAVMQLAREAVAAGFYNIDVDTSTLVDLHRADARRAAAAQLRGRRRDHGARALDPAQGRHDLHWVARSARSAPRTARSTELRAYMDGLNAVLAKRLPPGTPGLSKISVQSGTSHGGVVLPTARSPT